MSERRSSERHSSERHSSERRSSSKSKKKRTTKRSTFADRYLQMMEDDDESMANDDEEMEAPEESEHNGAAESLSAEERQVLGDIETLETVLTELVNRRKQGSISLSADPLTPPSGSSSATDATRVNSDEGRKTVAEEKELVQEDVDRLDRFLDQMDEQRAHGKQTPPGRPTITTPPDPANTRGSIIKYENLKDSRLSHIVSIDDEITRELNKVHAELRKGKTRRSSRRTTGATAADSSYRKPSPSLASSSSLSSSHSHSTTGEVTDLGGVLYSGEPAAESSQGEEASWFSFEGFNVPSETSSMETLPPSLAELMVQYNPDFLTESPSDQAFDPFIRKTIQRILDLKTTFPDENLYLIPSSSIPPEDLPHLSSLFEVATVAHTESQMLQEPSHSSIPPGKMSSPAGLSKRASVEIDTLSEGAKVKRYVGDLIGQTLIDYLGGSQTTLETDDTKARLPNSPSKARVSVKESSIARHENSVSPDKKSEQKSRTTISRPASDHSVVRRESTSPARANLHSVLSSTISHRSEASSDAQVPSDNEHVIKPTETPIQPESPDAAAAAALKSSLRSASATQTPMKQKPEADPAALPSSDKVEPVELPANVSSLVKKKVSFADMNSTMYILVNPSSEVSSRESETGGCCTMSDISVVQATPAAPHPHNRRGIGAKARDSLSLSKFDSIHNPHLSTSTPTSPTRSGPPSCRHEEAHRPSAEALSDLATPCHAITHVIHPSAEALVDLATPCHAITGSITHVICRARSSAEHGRAISGSRDRWVTRVNSRSLSFPTDQVVFVCPNCGSESYHSTTSECVSLPAPCPPSSSSDVVTVVRLPQASCSHCPMVNRNYSCSESSTQGEEGEESDSLQTSVSDHTSTGSSLGDTPDEDEDGGGGGKEEEEGGGGVGGGPVSSSAGCNIAASESRNSDVCSTVSVVFNVRDRNRSRNQISEK